MPNWCSNTTAVQGPDPHLEDFIARVTVGVEEIRLSDLVPLPADAIKDSNGISVFTDNGYETALKLWGTKWGDCDTEYQGNGFFFYRTAWGPFDRGLMNISAMFPKLRFVTGWYEEDFNYGGFVCEDGEIVEQFEGRMDAVSPPDYDKDPDAYDRWWERQWESLIDLGQIMLTERL